MKKMTLLAMVQNILSALDSDEVNSISDTVESLQVAEIIKETYYEQFNNIFLPEFSGLFRVSSLSDLGRPNYLKLPSNVSKVEWIKYIDHRNKGKFVELEYVSPEEFLERRLQYHSGSHNVVETTDTSGISYLIHNDRTPRYFTMFDDEHIATDAYDSAYDTILQSANTMGYGILTEEFEMADEYVPPIDASLFPLLLAESKSVAFINLKQISSSKEEQRARRQRIRMQNDQFRARKAQNEYFNRGPNYARYR